MKRFLESLLYVLSIKHKSKKDNTTGNPSLSNGNATDSICPYGWQLPESGGGADSKKTFSNLANIHTLANGSDLSNADTLMINFPISFPRTGYYNSSSSIYHRNLRSYYWTLYGYSETNAYHLFFYSTYVGPIAGNNRGYGNSVRCLAR